MRQGIRRAHVEICNHPKLRRPLTWEVVKGLEGCAVVWGVGERVVWMGLALSFLLLLWASELFADDRGDVHAVYCLRRGGVAFSRGDHQVYGNRVGEANKVEMRFRGLKEDQGRKGTLLGRTVGPTHRERGALELLAELTRGQGDVGVLSNLLLMAYRSGKGWRVLTREPMVIQSEGSWSSDAFMTYVRAKLENLQ